MPGCYHHVPSNLLLGRGRKNHGLIVGFTRCEMQHNTTATDPNTLLCPTQSQMCIILLCRHWVWPYFRTAYVAPNSHLRHAVYTATASCALSLRPLAPTKPVDHHRSSNRRKPPAEASWPFLHPNEVCLHVLERLLDSSSSHGEAHLSLLLAGLLFPLITLGLQGKVESISSLHKPPT